MLDLPDVIARPKWPNDDRHPLFRTHATSPFRRELATATIAGHKVPLTLFMTPNGDLLDVIVET